MLFILGKQQEECRSSCSIPAGRSHPCEFQSATGTLPFTHALRHAGPQMYPRRVNNTSCYGNMLNQTHAAKSQLPMTSSQIPVTQSQLTAHFTAQTSNLRHDNHCYLSANKSCFLSMLCVHLNQSSNSAEWQQQPSLPLHNRHLWTMASHKEPPEDPKKLSFWMVRKTLYIKSKTCTVSSDLTPLCFLSQGIMAGLCAELTSTTRPATTSWPASSKEPKWRNSTPSSWPSGAPSGRP